MSTRRGTLLWIDVPGLGSRVSAQPYAEGARMMRVFRGILLPPCDAFGGRLASAVGDSFQIVFRRPTDAVLAARVRGAAGRGDVVLSGDVFAAMDKSRLTAEELGDADGVPAEVRLYRLARVRGSELPFGGIGLDKAGRLPDIGPDGILQGGDSAVLRAIAPLRARVRGSGPRALDMLASGEAWARRQVGRLPPNVRALPATEAAQIARVPRKARLAIAAGLAVAVAATVVLAVRRGDPIERAL